MAATNERLVRVFSISGSQTQLLSLHGPVVSMAMHEKQLLIFYLKSGGMIKFSFKSQSYELFHAKIFGSYRSLRKNLNRKKYVIQTVSWESFLFKLYEFEYFLLSHFNECLFITHFKLLGFNDCHCFGVLQLHLRKNTWKVASDSTFISKPKSILSWIG